MNGVFNPGPGWESVGAGDDMDVESLRWTDGDGHFRRWVRKSRVQAATYFERCPEREGGGVQCARRRDHDGDHMVEWQLREALKDGLL